MGAIFHKGHESLCDLVWCRFLLIYDGNPVSLDADFFALFFKCLDQMFAAAPASDTFDRTEIENGGDPAFVV